MKRKIWIPGIFLLSAAFFSLIPSDKPLQSRGDWCVGKAQFTENVIICPGKGSIDCYFPCPCDDGGGSTPPVVIANP
ncbi:MAG: hypothetical protein KatS3mg033_2044 [Thermonema sp.]|nr:MAG: hypothetical protein KatS3mg033_2044 [Thermonema sp.]